MPGLSRTRNRQLVPPSVKYSYIRSPIIKANGSSATSLGRPRLFRLRFPDGTRKRDSQAVLDVDQELGHAQCGPVNQMNLRVMEPVFYHSGLHQFGAGMPGKHAPFPYGVLVPHLLPSPLAVFPVHLHMQTVMYGFYCSSSDIRVILDTGHPWSLHRSTHPKTCGCGYSIRSR